MQRKRLISPIGVLTAVLAVFLMVSLALVTRSASASMPTQSSGAQAKQAQVQQPLLAANVQVVALPAGKAVGISQPRSVGAVQVVPPSAVHELKQNSEPLPVSDPNVKPSGSQNSRPIAPDVPQSNAVGSSGAFVSLSPDVVKPGSAVALVATGFRPGEVVVLAIPGFIGAPAYFLANADGVILITLTTGATTNGYFNVTARGLYTGKVAGGVFQVTSSATAVPGVAVGPHAVNTGNVLYLFAVGYSPNISVTFMRDGSPFFVAATSATGTSIVTVTFPSVSDGSAVWGTAAVTNTVGTKAGQSIEERSDSLAPAKSGSKAPQADNNVSRAFVDRAVMSNSVTTTVGLAGEGFQPGEAVALTYIEGGAVLSTAPADANGAVSFLLQAPPGAASIYDFRLNAVASGRVAFASLESSGDALNVPSSLVAPANGNSTGSVTFLFTKFAPSQAGGVLLDGSPIGGATTNVQGYGAVIAPKPTSLAVAHNYAFSTNAGQSAPAPFLLAVGNSNVLSGTVTDAGSGLPIKATISVVGSTEGAVVQSDPTNGGRYRLQLAPGTYTISAVGSGCYMPQSVSVTIDPTNPTIRNFSMVRSGTDAGGYSCFENAGRTYTPATNAIFTPSFDDSVVSMTLPFPVTYYGTAVTTGTISTNGFMTIGTQDTSSSFFTNSCIPSTTTPNGTVAVIWDDLVGSGGDSNVYTSVVGTAPSRTFIVEWRSFSHIGESITNTAELQIDEATNDIYMVYPTFNVSAGDGRSATIGIENTTGTIAKQYECNTGTAVSAEVNNYLWAGNSVRFFAGAVSTVTSTSTQSATITGTPPTTTSTSTSTATRTSTNTSTATATPAPCGPNSNYTVVTGTVTSPITATTLIAGSQGDDVTAPITLPFAYNFYGQSFTTARVSSNGNLQFSSSSTSFSNTALPNASFNNAIFPFWDDLRTDGTGNGIFADVSGTSPNQIYTIEWRGCIRTGTACAGQEIDFTLTLYQGQGRFDVNYINIPSSGTGANGVSATTGVQQGTGSLFTQYSFNQAVLTTGLQLVFTQVACATVTGTPPTVTGTSTATMTGTATNTSTPTNTPTVTNTFAPLPSTTTTAVVIVSSTATSTATGPQPTATRTSTAVNTSTVTTTSTAVGTTTRTATAGATATCTSGGPIVVNGSIDPTDPTASARLFRDGVASTCAAPKAACPGTFTGAPPYHYDSYTFTNTSGSSQCVTVDLASAANIQAVTYLGSFDPANICTNYLADPGLSTGTGGTVTASFTLAAGATFVQVVNDPNGSTGTGGAYTLTITGLGSAPCTTGTVTTTPQTTSTTTRTATVTLTAGATATCIPQAGGWTAGPSFPLVGIVRGVGVYFPTNGKFYNMGGRSSDTAGSDLTTPYEFTPGTPGTWVAKSAVLPDINVNNMACGVLTMSGTPQIYCVGGSAAGGTTASARVFSYNPATDVITTLTAADNWPGDASGTVLPGGFAVATNKLYIVGGFDIGTGMTNQTWQFDPTAAAGSKWTQKVNYPVSRGYIPMAAIGSTLYTGGGSDYDGSAVLDTADSFKFDTANNTWTAIPNIPRATGETRAVVVNGQMWVLGGGRVAPNPSNEVDVFTPGSPGTWTTGPSFTNARRNFSADSNGSMIWLVGGYEPATPANDMEIYRPSVVCGTTTTTPTIVSTATRTATVASTSTRTNTAVASGTSTAIPSTTSIRTSTAVASGTSTAVASATGTAVSTSTNTAVAATETVQPQATATACAIRFADVPTTGPGSTFYTFIRCLACRGIIGGYPCGATGEPCNSTNDPYFRPTVDVTRGQISKMVVLSAGLGGPVPAQIFEDVLPSNTFYDVIQQLASRGYIGGYPCGQIEAEPCITPGNRPYFRPSTPTTRGQLTKIVSNTAQYTDDPGAQRFTDVPTDSPFYVWVNRLASRSIIGGYPCGEAGEPCDAQNRPYFRPNTNVSRGQTSKIVANTFFPNCQTPAGPVQSANH